MKKIFCIISLAVAVLGITACGSAEKMAKQAEQVIVNCNPSPLAVKGGKIEANLEVVYPEKYFNKKAILEVTPVLVYGDQEIAADVLTYQGEKVDNNFTVVPADGGTVKQTITFNYVPGMEQCYLELRGRCTVNNGKKWVEMPSKKAADGLNINETLVCTKGYYSVKDDGYQAIIFSTEEGQIMYRINSADVRSTELSGKSVADFKNAIKEVSKNERKAIKGVEVIAYASPDGGVELNAKLSDKRSESAKVAYDKVAKAVKLAATPDVKSTGQDWEGFKDVVAKSNVDDKDLIVRVLEMYSDAAVREKEIKNMASVYQELAKDVLPQLRRARFIANVEFTNFTDEELVKLVKEDIEVLDENALLKAATLVEDNDQKIAIYTQAAEKFNSDRAKFDIVCVDVDKNDIDAAKTHLDQCSAEDPDVVNIAGVCALRNNNIVAAKQLFEISKTDNANKNLGVCAIKEGDYATAAAKLGDKGCNAALAQLLNGNVDAALACIGDEDCAQCNYIKAICLNRQGKTDEAKAALKKATDACDKLAARAQVDIEFANLR